MLTLEFNEPFSPIPIMAAGAQTTFWILHPFEPRVHSHTLSPFSLHAAQIMLDVDNLRRVGVGCKSTNR